MSLQAGDIIRISHNGPGHIAGKLAEVQFDYPVTAQPDMIIIVNVQNHGEEEVLLKYLEPDVNFLDWKKDPELMKKLADAEVSSGGSLRYNKGKPQFSHLSPEFIQDMMALMTASADKYGYLNWTKAQDVRTASDSLMRHFLKFQQGDTYDEESGYSHLTHVAVNAMIIFQNLKDFGDKVDNRFSVEKEKVQNGN